MTTFGQRGPKPGLPIVQSPHRGEIDKWLFEEKCSLNEVERRCKEQGWEIGKRTIATYARHYAENNTLTEYRDENGRVIADRALRSFHQTGMLAQEAGKQLWDLLHEKKLDIEQLLKLRDAEAKLLGTVKIAAFAEERRQWERAFAVLFEAITDLCDEDTVDELLARCRQDADFNAVFPDTGEDADEFEETA